MSTTETANAEIRKDAVRNWEHAASAAVAGAAQNLASLHGTLLSYAGEPVGGTNAWKHALSAAEAAVYALRGLPADIAEIVAFRMAELAALETPETGEPK